MSGKPTPKKPSDFKVSYTYKQHTWTPTYKGIDFLTPVGTICTVFEEGIVEYVGVDGVDTAQGQANMVRIKAKSGLWDYVHIEKGLVSKGRKVKVGDAVFVSGQTGWVSGPLTHVGLLVDGKYVDPQPYINKLNIKELIMDEEVKKAFADIKKSLNTLNARSIVTKDLTEQIFYFQRGQSEVIEFNKLLIQTTYKPEKKNNRIMVRYSEDDGNTWQPWLEDGTGSAPVTHVIIKGKYLQFVRGINYGDWMRSTTNGKIWTEWKEI